MTMKISILQLLTIISGLFLQNLEYAFGAAVAPAETPLLAALDKNSSSFEIEAAVIRSVTTTTTTGYLVNFKNSSGASPLHIAVERDNQWAVDFLLHQGANVNSIQTTIDKTPLHIAAERGNLAITRALLANGAAYVHSGAKGTTPLHLAAEKGHLPVVQALVAAGANVSRRETSRLILPHHLAAANGHLLVLRFLAEHAHGANLTAQTLNKETALDLAAASGHFDIVKYLVQEKKLDVNKPVVPLNVSEGGFSYTWTSFNNFSPNYVGYFKSKQQYGSQSKTPLMHATETGYTRIVEFLIAAGADVNTIANEGTALSLAAKRGDWDLVSMLIRVAGATANFGAITRSGSSSGYSESFVSTSRTSPLEFAIDSGNVSNVKLLVPASVTSDPVMKGKALLHAAEAKSSSLEMVQILIQYGADAAAVQNSTTTLFVAAANNVNPKTGLEISKWLLLSSGKRRSIIEERNDKGETALYRAIHRANWELVRLLITKHGANVNVRNKDGWTPLLLAAMRNSTDAVRLLLANGANVNAASNYGALPILNAVTQRRYENATLEIVRVLVEAGALNNSTVVEKVLLKAVQDGVESVTVYILDVASAYSSGLVLQVPLMQKVAREAAKRGFVKVLKKLQAHSAKFDDIEMDAFSSSSSKSSLLAEAASGNHTEAVKFLVQEARVDVNRKSGYGQETALHFAAKKANLELVQLLVERGADMNAITKYGRTPTAEALSGFSSYYRSTSSRAWEVGARFRIADYLLSAGADPLIKSASIGSDSLLHILAGSSELARFESKMGPSEKQALKNLVRNILVKHLQVDNVNKDGETALARAASNGFLLMAEVLLDAKANVHAKDASGQMVLHKAAAATAGKLNPTLVNGLLQAGAGADVNIVDNVQEDTPLTLLCGLSSSKTFENGNPGQHLELVQAFVLHGANVNHRTRRGGTPLTKLAAGRANLEGTFETVRYLVQRGARIGAGELEEFGKLLGYGSGTNWNILYYLVMQMQANVSMTEKVQQLSGTLLIQAAKAGEWDTVRFLVNAGAEVGQRESKWNNATVLHYAVKQRGNFPMIKFLVQHGAGAYARSGDGSYTNESPLQLAQKLKPEPDIDVLQYLQNYA